MELLLVKRPYWGHKMAGHQVTQHTADMVTHISAGATVAGGAAFFSMQWWNENSAGVVAICAVIGALISITSFILGRIAKRRADKVKKE